MKSILFGMLPLALVACVGVDNSQFKLRSAIDANQTQVGLARCYTQALVNDDTMEGTMRLVIRVPRNSDRIDMVEPSGESQLTNPGLMGPMHRCFQRALMGLSIAAAPIEGDLYVEYAFQLSRDGNSAFLAPAATGPKATGRIGVTVTPANMQVEGNVDANVDANVEGNVNVDLNGGRPKIRGGAKVDVKAGLGIR